jgi:pyrroline-5-carboxylate reductase
MKLGVIGGGAMGEAIIAAVTRAKVAQPADIAVHDLLSSRCAELASTYSVRAADSASGAATGVEFVLLSVKPQDFEKAASGLADGIGSAVAVSIMAGVPIAKLTKLLNTQSVVRAMPNTPAQIGEGMTGWTASEAVSPEARAEVRRIFAAMGKEAYLPDEKYLDMVTGLSGSGPGYVFLFLEALTDAGVHVGLPRDIAYNMALQTVLGSARYAETTGKHPAELRNQVTSAGGTTAEALRTFEAGSFRSVVLEAVVAAFEKSKALGMDDKS